MKSETSCFSLYMWPLKQLIWTLKCWSDGQMLGDGGAALTGCGSRPSPPPAGCVRIEARSRSEVCLLPPNSWCLQDTNQTGFYYHYHYCDIIMVIISNVETTGSEMTGGKTNSGSINWVIERGVRRGKVNIVSMDCDVVELQHNWIMLHKILKILKIKILNFQHITGSNRSGGQTSQFYRFNSDVTPQWRHLV